MAQTLNWTTLTVPGSLAVTGNPLDTAVMQSCAGDRCPRCERHQSDIKCSGVTGEPQRVS